MKLHKLLLAIASVAMLATGCEERVIGPGDNDNNQGEMTPPDTTAQLITLKEAKALIDSISIDTLSESGRKEETLYVPGRFKLVGTVTKNITNPVSVPGNTHSNISINIELGDDEEKLDCYYIKNLYNLPFTSSNQVPRVGSKIEIIAQLEWYWNKNRESGSYEAANGFVVRYDSIVSPGTVPDCPAPGEGEISVSEAFSMAMKLADRATTPDEYSVIGVVSEITENGPVNGYKNATFNITDNKNYLVGYRINGFSQPENIEVGDTVVIKGKVQNYSGLAEISSGALVRTSNRSMIEDTTKISPDAPGVEVPEGCLNVYQARHICAELASGKSTSENYYVKGWVYKVTVSAEDIASYNNATFYISATEDGSTKTFDFEAYRVKGKNGTKLYSLDQIKEGDFVVLYGKMTNYNGTYETASGAVLYASSNPDFDPKEDPTKITPDPEGANVPEGCLNVYEARDKCKELASGKATSETYRVKGWIRSVTTTEADVKNYGNATFTICATNDGKTDPFSFTAYRIKSLNNARFNSLDEFKVGDFVVIECKLKNYNGTYENDNGAKLYYSNNPLLQPGTTQN